MKGNDGEKRTCQAELGSTVAVRCRWGRCSQPGVVGWERGWEHPQPTRGGRERASLQRSTLKVKAASDEASIKV